MPRFTNFRYNEPCKFIPIYEHYFRYNDEPINLSLILRDYYTYSNQNFFFVYVSSDVYTANTVNAEGSRWFSQYSV
jgi:hypothetical protein